MKQPSDHPMVLGALGRLATQGGWSRILARKPLEDSLDLNDAQLLVACGLLRADVGDIFEPVPSPVVLRLDRPGRWCGRHAAPCPAPRRGRHGRLDGRRPARRQGPGQGQRGRSNEHGRGASPGAPAHQAFLDGKARFLDVVSASAPLPARLGDVSRRHRRRPRRPRPVLEVARPELETAGMLERVELRLQSVADLGGGCAFDLASLPQAFMPRPTSLPAYAPCTARWCPTAG